MKGLSAVLFILISTFSSAQVKFAGNDSTVAILSGWISVISQKEFIDPVCMRGVSRPEYDNNLKIINLSLENYRKGNYQYAFEDIEDVKFTRFPEIERIKLLMQTMSNVRLNKKFKARKWYYHSEHKMDNESFGKLKNNITNLKLGYKIDNYRRVRGGRLTALFIGAGILGGASLLNAE
ncbi:MAG TPA: hypothetical protein VF868_06160 [Bacteroidia bacterium]|jgi:hypothetical protein